jgi:hypothetical protein
MTQFHQSKGSNSGVSVMVYCDLVAGKKNVADFMTEYFPFDAATSMSGVYTFQH